MSERWNSIAHFKETATANFWTKKFLSIQVLTVRSTCTSSPWWFYSFWWSSSSSSCAAASSTGGENAQLKHGETRTHTSREYCLFVCLRVFSQIYDQSNSRLNLGVTRSKHKLLVDISDNAPWSEKWKHFRSSFVSEVWQFQWIHRKLMEWHLKTSPSSWVSDKWPTIARNSIKTSTQKKIAIYCKHYNIQSHNKRKRVSLFLVPRPFGHVTCQVKILSSGNRVTLPLKIPIALPAWRPPWH